MLTHKMKEENTLEGVLAFLEVLHNSCPFLDDDWRHSGVVEIHEFSDHWLLRNGGRFSCMYAEISATYNKLQS